ncbi:MAG: gephyrin-like molybdotransferase Glp [Dongiaceae bacterium]
MESPIQYPTVLPQPATPQPATQQPAAPQPLPGQWLRLDEARLLLRRQLRCCVSAESVPLSAALNRILAEDVMAPVDLPHQDRSAVDGYAVRAADLIAGRPTLLLIAGQAAAGHPLNLPAAVPEMTGGAVRIFTGATVPEGFDTVIQQEACRSDGIIVTIPAGIARGGNVRLRGEDYRMGMRALPQGHRLRPRDLGLAAALGLPALPVYRRLRVALFSTGDELLDPETQPFDGALSVGQSWDANRYMLKAQLIELGCEVSDFGILPDRLGKTIGALAEAAHDHDFIVTSGGMSVGDEDYVKHVIRRRGHLELWRLAIKPGRPVGFGDIDDCPILALPGNPVAAAVTFIMLGSLAVARLSGSGENLPRGFQVMADFSLNKLAGRREFLPAILDMQEGGPSSATPVAKKGSAMLSALTWSDGLIDLPEEIARVAPGDNIHFIPFRQPGF